jgi:transposase
LFVLYTAIPWERLPFEVAGCSGMTCWRRLRAWQDAGLWDRIHRHMLDRLNLAGEIDWSRASVDSSSVAAKRGATSSARTRLIAASRAPSATSWSTGAASLSPSS